MQEIVEIGLGPKTAYVMVKTRKGGYRKVYRAGRFTINRVDSSIYDETYKVFIETGSQVPLLDVKTGVVVLETDQADRIFDSLMSTTAEQHGLLEGLDDDARELANRCLAEAKATAAAWQLVPQATGQNSAVATG